MWFYVKNIRKVVVAFARTPNGDYVVRDADGKKYLLAKAKENKTYWQWPEVIL
jgi:hypothetical protein